MKNLIYILLLLLSFYKSLAQTSEKSILDFTKNNYFNLIKAIPENILKEFGFTTKNDLDHLTFSHAFAEYTIINEVPVKTNNYRVLALNAQNKPCGLFTIFIKDNVMEVVDYGAYDLAINISEKLTQFNSKSQLSFLRVFEIKTDFLFDDALKSENQKFVKIYGNESYSLNNLISQVK